jgi:hypothetical protein
MKTFLPKSGLLTLVFLIPNNFFYTTITIPGLDDMQVSIASFNRTSFLSG